MIINHNLSAINAYNKLKDNSIKSEKAMNKISSGLKINTAADNAAGSAISEKMKTQIRGLQHAYQNIQDGISLIDTADSGLGNIIDPNLLRIKQLSVQASNGTLTNSDLEKVQQEINQILNEIDSIANNTEFNGIKLLNGTNPNPSSMQANVQESPFDYKDILQLPMPNGSGRLALSTNKGYPTTTADDNKILVYGTGGTSWPSVIVNGENYYFQGHGSSDTNPDGTTIQVINDTIEDDKYKTTYNIINSPNNVDLEVTQSIGIVADKYEIRYDIKNNSSSTSKVGFQFNVDTDIANNDAAKFIVDGDVISQEKLYSGSGIPDYFNVYNEAGSTNKIQASGILRTQENPYDSSIKYEILEEPLKFGLGKWNQGVETNNWNPQGNYYGDSAYSIWWNEKDLTNGEIRSVNTFYGLSVPPTIPKPEPIVINEKQTFDIKLQIGANSGNEFNIQLSDVRTEKLFENGASVETSSDANNLMKYVDDAIEKVSNERTKYGSYKNALQHTKNNVSNYEINISKAESNVTDADMAKEITEQAKYEILKQSSQAMLSQSKDIPSQVLNIMAMNSEIKN